MKCFEVRRVIAASPARIWEVLTDGPALVAGGLGLSRLDGRIVPGGRLTIYAEASPGRGFALRVTEFVPGQRMVWEGGMPFGLFTGRRQFTLATAGEGTEFHMREEFSGWLAPLIGRSIPDLAPSFETFADGVRRLAEAPR